MRKMVKQLIKFAIVGLSSNALLYFLYLLLTTNGLGPKTAMTIVYILGVIVTFWFNRGWTFNYPGRQSTTLIKYFTMYGLGYVANFVILRVLVDHHQYPHQIVQGVTILVLALSFFVISKYWVFPTHQHVHDHTV
ncbi:MAG: GtrA family protein [Pseudomonadota bacterium]